MGTSVAVLLPDREVSAVAAVALLFRRWEETFSRFDPASELSRLNVRAGRRVAVTPLAAAPLDLTARSRVVAAGSARLCTLLTDALRGA